jgi:hypothetical protein
MINLERVYFLLCDLFTKVYYINLYNNFYIDFRNKRFNFQSNNYWSAITYANNTDNAWNVNFKNGNDNNNNKTNNKYFRCVRLNG